MASRPRSVADGARKASLRPTERAPKTSIPPSLTARVVENGILAAAMKVFPKRGFASTRVEDILEEAGIARRTFYRYFTSKEDVLAAVYELSTSVLLQALDDASAATDPLAGLRSCVELYIAFHVENAGLLRVLVQESVRSDSPLAALRRGFRTRLVKVFVRAATTRRVTPLDGFTYVALVSALEGVTLELLDGPGSPSDVVRAKNAVLALVDRGLTARDT